MTDDPVRTRLLTDEGWLDFQDYFVHRRCEPVVSELQFQGAGAAKPHPDFIAALADPALEAVVICPSNPFISVEPILAIPGVREALMACEAPIIARFADHRRPGGEGADGEDDDGTGAGPVGRDGRASAMPSCWTATSSTMPTCREVVFDRCPGDAGADADDHDGGPRGTGEDRPAGGGGAAPARS